MLTLGYITVASQAFYYKWNNVFFLLLKVCFLTVMLESLKQGVYVGYVVIHIQDDDEADS